MKAKPRPKEIIFKATKEKILFAAYVNTDLTEGRGQTFVMALSECESTARRLGKGQNVQGCDARIEKTKAFFIASHGSNIGTWYSVAGRISDPSLQDLEQDKKLHENQAKEILLEKFKIGATLSEEERNEILNLIR